MTCGKCICVGKGKACTAQMRLERRKVKMGNGRLLVSIEGMNGCCCILMHQGRACMWLGCMFCIEA